MTALSEKAIDQFETIWDSCEPFYVGKSTVPDYQLSLYYTQPEGDVYRHIHFAKAEKDELAALYAACKPAQFGWNREAVRDDTYRKGKKMDLDSFATLFDPRCLGIMEQASRGLLGRKRDPGITEMELYKLNVYGEGDFFKPHQDTPRSQSMVGSLIVVLPTQYEGGQLVLRQSSQEWTLDFADKFAAATDPLVYFVAFFGNIEQEVLPVTSGYRVTLTYNLYCEHPHPNATYFPTPFYERLKKALVEFINDKSTLPEGGYLSYGLIHDYVYNEDQPINVLLYNLKGADQILATICEELGLQHSLTLLYRDLNELGINLIACGKLNTESDDPAWSDHDVDFLGGALSCSTTDDVEGVEIVGHPFDRSPFEGEHFWELVQSFYRDPVTKILEIRPMSSVSAETTYISYANELTEGCLYGEASMLIALGPAASREELVL